jgi:GH43 family beta-xylosidase
MSDPWTNNSERVLISRPTFDWEKRGGGEINEGSEVSIRNNVISFVYSASGSASYDCCRSLITSS